MTFSPVSDTILNQFSQIVGPEFVLVSAHEDFGRYASDETEDLQYFPEVVLKPANAEQISEIVKLCHENFIPVTPRGAGTGLSGGALPIHKGVVISTERLNKIIEIDERNLQATVEPGVINEVFQNAVQEDRKSTRLNSSHSQISYA